jgi:hypothetical protein
MVDSKLALTYSEGYFAKLLSWFKEQNDDQAQVYLVENIRMLTEFLVYGEKY